MRNHVLLSALSRQNTYGTVIPGMQAANQAHQPSSGSNIGMSLSGLLGEDI